MNDWPTSFIFSLECCESKEGPVRFQMGPVAFNYLHTPLYTPIWGPPSAPSPHHHSYYYYMQYHYPHEKLLRTAWILGAWKLYIHIIIIANILVLAINFIFSAYYTWKVLYNHYLKLPYLQKYRCASKPGLSNPITIAQ